MIKPKGIAEAVAAVRRARDRGAPVELDLYGAPDPSNRTSFTEADLRQWASEPGINWRGVTEDVAGVYREHHVAMLLSVREGLPEVPGRGGGRRPADRSRPTCPGAGRSFARDAKAIWCRSGTSTPPRRRWSSLPAIGRCGLRLGAAANARFHERFTLAAVKAVFADLYRSLIPAPGRPGGTEVEADPARPLPIEG